MTGMNHSRREALKKMGYAAIAAGVYWKAPSLLASPAPTAPVAVGTCKTYNPAELLSTLGRMFDQLGGLKRIVNGKTVAIKINLTGAPTYRVGYLPLGDTHYTNPQVITAAVHLIGKAGAKRIRILESSWSSAYPLEETLLQADFDPRQIESAAPNVEFENTNFLGKGKKYSRLVVPFGGYVFPAYELNHSYSDCDVFVSMAKMKEHETTGITLSMKNCFGITPCSIYGASAGVDDPDENPKGGRGLLHSGNASTVEDCACGIRHHDPQARRLSGAAGGGRFDRGSPRRSANCRWSEINFRGRRAVGSGNCPRATWTARCRNESSRHRRSLHGVDGPRSYGGPRNSPVRGFR